MLRQKKEKANWDHDLKMYKKSVEYLETDIGLVERYKEYVSKIGYYLALAIADRRTGSRVIYLIKDELDKVFYGKIPKVQIATAMEREYFDLLIKEARKYRRLEKAEKHLVRLEYEKILCEEKLEKLEKLKESMEKVIESMERNEKYMRE